MALKKSSQGWPKHAMFHGAWVISLTLFLATLFTGCGQTGPVGALGHQGLACVACHSRSAGWERQMPGGSVTMTRSCLACHEGHGAHHPQQLVDQSHACSVCHSEHHGKNELTRVSDR
jgi:hypothetical protein